MCDLPQCVSVAVDVPSTEPGQAFNVYGESLWLVPVRRTAHGWETKPGTFQHLVACGADPDTIVPMIDYWDADERKAWLETLPWIEDNGPVLS